MADQFSRALARVAVVQVAEAVGFDAVQSHAADAIADVLLRYITQLGAASHSYAEMAGRSDTNVFDILLAFEDLGVNIDDLTRMRFHEEEVPFAHALPPYPVEKAPQLLPSFLERGEVPPAHVPGFLPAFPDPHTYTATPVFPGHERNPAKAVHAMTSARKAAEASLIQLHKRTSAPLAPAANGISAAAHVNPYLAPTLWEEGGGPSAQDAAGESPQASPARAAAAAAAAAAPSAREVVQEVLRGTATDGAEPETSKVLWTTWRKEEEDSEDPARLLGPRAPIAFDWATSLRQRALSHTTKKAPDDAFEAEAAVAAAGGNRGRKRKLTSKAAAANIGGDLASETVARKVEQIIAAAANNVGTINQAVSDEHTERPADMGVERI